MRNLLNVQANWVTETAAIAWSTDAQIYLEDKLHVQPSEADAVLDNILQSAEFVRKDGSVVFDRNKMESQLKGWISAWRKQNGW